MNMGGKQESMESNPVEARLSVKRRLLLHCSAHLPVESAGNVQVCAFISAYACC